MESDSDRHLVRRETDEIIPGQEHHLDRVAEQSPFEDDEDDVDGGGRAEFNITDYFQQIKPVEFSSSSEEETQDFEEFILHREEQGTSFVDFSRGIYEVQQHNLMDSDERPTFSHLSDIMEKSDEYRLDTASPESLHSNGRYPLSDNESDVVCTLEEGTSLLDDVSDTHDVLPRRLIRFNSESEAGSSSLELDKFARERHEFQTAQNGIMADGENAILADGENAMLAEGANAILADGENAMLAEGANAILADGENAILAEGANAILADGENAILAEGANAILADGENAILADGENAILTDGESPATKVDDVKQQPIITNSPATTRRRVRMTNDMALPNTAPKRLRMPTVRRLERLKVDRSISIQGLVDDDAKDFSVCLQSTSSAMPHTDILFMVKPCFGVTGCTIVCNTFLYESFGTSTVFRPQDLFTKSFPFSQGKSFNMVIVIRSNHYEVLVDERSIFVFDHRVTSDKVSHIRIEGDMKVEFLECPRTMKLPYIKELPHGLRDGQVLLIDTLILPQSKSFQLHLTAKHMDIYAGFYTRVTFEGVITKVRCQGFVNDKRDEEVTIDGHLPIFRNKELELRVVIGQHRIVLLLDGEWFADYDHQLPIEKLNSLTMDGDIELYEAAVHKPKGHFLSLGHHKSRCCECCVM